MEGKERDKRRRKLKKIRVDKEDGMKESSYGEGKRDVETSIDVVRKAGKGRKEVNSRHST